MCDNLGQMNNGVCLLWFGLMQGMFYWLSYSWHSLRDVEVSPSDPEKWFVGFQSVVHSPGSSSKKGHLGFLFLFCANFYYRSSEGCPCELTLRHPSEDLGKEERQEV